MGSDVKAKVTEEPKHVKSAVKAATIHKEKDSDVKEKVIEETKDIKIAVKDAVDIKEKEEEVTKGDKSSSSVSFGQPQSEQNPTKEQENDINKAEILSSKPKLESNDPSRAGADKSSNDAKSSSAFKPNEVPEKIRIPLKSPDKSDNADSASKSKEIVSDLQSIKTTSTSKLEVRHLDDPIGEPEKERQDSTRKSTQKSSSVLENVKESLKEFKPCENAGESITTDAVKPAPVSQDEPAKKEEPSAKHPFQSSNDDPEETLQSDAEPVEAERDSGTDKPTEEEEDGEENLKISQAEDKDVSKSQLSFDYDASLQSKMLLHTKTLLSAMSTPRSRGRPKRVKPVEGPTENTTDTELTPVRQSSRIAKLREKEDEDRKMEEASRLQRLKEEHDRREKRRLARDERKRKIEEKQQRRQLKTITGVAPEEYYESEDEESSSDGETEKSRLKEVKEKRKKRKKRKDTPWDSSESSEAKSESEEDGLDDLHVEEDEELVFKSDHEFSPESDLDEDDLAVQPRKHARTARADDVPKKRGRKPLKAKLEEIEEEDQEEEEEEEEEEEVDHSCQKCAQSDHPEWILLCDRCDLGWHASCPKPPLMVIPEKLVLP